VAPLSPLFSPAPSVLVPLSAFAPEAPPVRLSALAPPARPARAALGALPLNVREADRAGSKPRGGKAVEGAAADGPSASSAARRGGRAGPPLSILLWRSR